MYVILTFKFLWLSSSFITYTIPLTISSYSTVRGVLMKNNDCFQCVSGAPGIVLRKTPSHNRAEKDPTNALKMPFLLT
jgi:hypothetical protein